MGPRRKAAEKLHKKLRESQELDIPLTGPEFVQIKFGLKHNRRCTHVSVVDSNPVASDNSIILPSQLPEFLHSQIQAQKLTADDFRPSSTVSIILQFATRHLADTPTQHSAFPTFLRWQQPNKRRCYYLLAYLADQMESRKYTTSELLELRGSQTLQALLDRARASRDLDEVVKTRSIPHVRSSKKVKESPNTSTDSEEHIVFQPKKQPRLPVGNFDGETEWKYRGRTDSERESSDPLCAPIGLTAQKNEGFQRFFKAVVSPTHIRVTAGGRIVPNTRMATSPNTKWNKEVSVPENNNPNHRVRTETSEADSSLKDMAGATQSVTPVMMQPMPSPMCSGFPHMIHPPMISPFIPFHNSLQLPYGMTYSPSNAQNLPHIQGNQTEKQGEADLASREESENNEDGKKNKPTPIKISPPEQFDQTKPYYFNGNVFLPGLSPLPCQNPTVHLTNNPYYTGLLHPLARISSLTCPPPVPSMVSPHGFLFPGYAQHGSAISSSESSFTPSIRATLRSRGSGNAYSGVRPPMTSIKPSEITRSQLNSLRAQLKYYEDQLQYNKHQIDEKATCSQIETIQKLIADFERNCIIQQEFEKSYYTKLEKEATRPELHTNSDFPPSTPVVREKCVDAASQSGSVKSIIQGHPSLNHAQSMENIRPLTAKKLRQKLGINSSKCDTTSLEALRALEEHLRNDSTSESTKKSSLPTGAAMAPPFEPRGGITQAPSNAGSTTKGGRTTDSFRLSTVGSVNLVNNGQWPDITMISPRLIAGRSASALGNKTTPQDSELGSPYLVGELPHEMDPRFVVATDYLYPRELTDDEKRARHIYWGKVSSKGLGLPKFDGKDFYPPSPIKTTARVTGPVNPRYDSTTVDSTPAVQTAKLSKKANDPFHHSRDQESDVSAQGPMKLSHAVPIINPDTLKRANITTAIAVNCSGAQVSTDSEYPDKHMQDARQPTVSQSATEAIDEPKMMPSNRKTALRSRGSTSELLQNILKKGTPGAASISSTLSSTQATGILPQYSGHAAASLAPAITNAKRPQLKAYTDCGKTFEQDGGAPLAQAEKKGENRPPGETDSKEADIIADLHQRMLRDAEQRGIISPDWRN
ncbi:hypothetical protein BX600DRAFT_493387 [Xylariales sp. PMI_506]|nr:hypothetical protein BX600DRAFT_493387 [Xylariales sp. PMI_506]